MPPPSVRPDGAVAHHDAQLQQLTLDTLGLQREFSCEIPAVSAFNSALRRGRLSRVRDLQVQNHRQPLDTLTHGRPSNGIPIALLGWAPR